MYIIVQPLTPVIQKFKCGSRGFLLIKLDIQGHIAHLIVIIRLKTVN